MAIRRGGRTTAAEKNTAQIAEEQVRCYQLRLAGLTLDQIAKATGLSKGTVHNRIQAEIDERVLPLAAEVRQVQLDRLDSWLVKLTEQIRQGRTVARNVEVAIRVEERRAKLLGLDEAAKTAVTVDAAPEVTALLDRAAAVEATED